MSQARAVAVKDCGWNDLLSLIKIFSHHLKQTNDEEKDNTLGMKTVELVEYTLLYIYN